MVETGGNRDQIKVVEAFIYCLAVVSLAFLCWSLLHFPMPVGRTEILVASVLALSSGLSRVFPVDFGRGRGVEVSDVAVLSALVVLGPLWAVVVALPLMVYRSPLRSTFSAAGDTVAILSSGYVFSLFAEPVLLSGSLGASSVYAVVAAGATFYVTDAIVNSVFARLKYGVPVLTTVSEFFVPIIPSDILAILAALGTSYVLVVFGPAAALVLFLGAAGALISLNLIYTRQRENEALKQENADLLSANVRFAAALVGAVGAKSPDLVRRTNASAVYAGDIGAEFGFGREHLDQLRMAALLQDVGFAGVPDAVVRAEPERLNREGRSELARHPVVGEEILASVPGLEEAAKWVRWHHERQDGSGFPDGLKARWIPLEARILAVASTYASLVPKLSPREARFVLASGVNGEVAVFDAEVVKALLRVLDREDRDYSQAAGERFSEAAGSGSENRVPNLRVVGGREG
ncbi:HD-GYP domain-containing protein [Rubrobacter indicoceani]|uniref:HD-GYP domain-containing protein n=1 Tax=Rubrobacter indicoceani TaxID=2051957 RepID=UPI000E5ABCD2|nr:HD domain-containing phosphohydrolase [Rubrobacter indicoceani]